MLNLVQLIRDLMDIFKSVYREHPHRNPDTLDSLVYVVLLLCVVCLSLCVSLSYFAASYLRNCARYDHYPLQTPTSRIYPKGNTTEIFDRIVVTCGVMLLICHRLRGSASPVLTAAHHSYGSLA